MRVALVPARPAFVAQFLTENLLLATIGAGRDCCWRLQEEDPDGIQSGYISRVEMVGIDTHVVIFLVCITVLTALALG